VCFQCVELDRYFNGEERNPLQHAADLDARLAVLRELRHQSPGPWHARLFELVRGVLS
jgi:RNA polymerase sigma-70 factor (ECF subfamily)